MWGNFGERLATALERTGDALTERATAHVKRTHESDGGGGGDKRDQEVAQEPRPTIVAIPPAEGTAPSSGREQQAVAEGSQPQPQSQPQPILRLRESLAAVGDRQKQDEMLGRLQLGWGSVVEATKHAVEATTDFVEKEQTRLQATAPSLFHKGPYRRDLALPLDVDALRDAEVVYITDRLITMSHPAMQSSTDGNITADRKLAAVAHLLQRRHGGRYMVWNLSEVEYNHTVLDEQVLTYCFPGSPSPPLGLLLKLLLSIESWLKADDRNVAALHCLTGRGRSSTVLAAFLCWTGEAGFREPNGALEYIARCKRLDVDALTIPSQRRYASYFANMLDGVRPSQPPLLLKRIIMSEAPKFGKRPTPDGGSSKASAESAGDDSQSQIGCAPYLQIFKAGNLVFTTAASMSYSQSKDDLPFCVPSDGPISFPVETIVQGDILVRCRHLTRKGQRVSMFRCAFHTGYVPPKVLRLTKAQLDGACSDKRFQDDFFLDLIFEQCDAAMASKHLMDGPGEEDEDEESGGVDGSETKSGKDGGDAAQNEAEERRKKGTVSTSTPAAAPTGGATVTASAYDTMLHRDSRFWDVIAKRRQENMKKMAAGEGGTSAGVEDSPRGEEHTALSGPTIGRRRDFASESDKPGKGEEGGKGGDGVKKASASGGERKPIETFSIGGDFDFGFDEDEIESKDTAAPARTDAGKTAAGPPPPPKRDELMEALMALDDDVGESQQSLADESEDEVVFNDDGDKGTPVVTPSPPTKQPTTEDTTEADKPDGAAQVLKEATTSPAVGAEIESDAANDKGAMAIAEKDSGGNVDINSGSDAGIDDDLVDLADEDEDTLGEVDALAAGDENHDIDFDDFDDDDDDDELEDLESFLTKASGK